MTRLEQLLEPFAQSIFAKMGAINTLNLTRKEKSRFFESMSDDIKKCSNFIAPEVSVKAKNKAEEFGFKLFNMNWHDMKSKDRHIFHFEHVNTVSAIREKCCEAKCSQDVLCILLNRLSIAWILKEEDKLLTAKGYKKNRPDNAYELAGITLVAKT